MSCYVPMSPCVPLCSRVPPCPPLSPCPRVPQINMLMQYKGGAEDEECPVPGDIRDELLDFHNDLLAHCGEGGTGTSPWAWGHPQGHWDLPRGNWDPHSGSTGTPTQGPPVGTPL